MHRGTLDEVHFFCLLGLSFADVSVFTDSQRLQEHIPGGKSAFDGRMVAPANTTDVTHGHGCDNGALMDNFGVLIQALLAVVAFSTLMLKRLREPAGIRRPWRIWFYDTSKQAIGALFIHFANVFLSTLTIEDPCSLYLMNFLLDATLGMLVIWAGVKAVSKVVEYKKVTLLTFGEYGEPPQVAAWVGQCAIYLLIVVLEKCMVSLVLLIPGWNKVQEVLLDYIPNAQLEVVLVMLIVPFLVNAIMFWVVDSLTMRKYKTLVAMEAKGDVVKQGEASSWPTGEESQVLLEPDTDPEVLEGEQGWSEPESPIPCSRATKCA